MNTTEFAAAVAAKTGMTKTAADDTVKATLDAIRDALAKGQEVRLMGFGTFTAKKVAAKTARNPRTLARPSRSRRRSRPPSRRVKGLSDASKA